MLTRLLPMTFSLLFALEPVLPGGGEVDLTKYAITQGGLVIVVFVLLWGIRAELRGKDQRLNVMMELVSRATAAQTESADAMNRMARAIELISERRHEDRR